MTQQTKYKVLTDQLPHPAGSIIGADELPEGTNVEALVEAGHLSTVKNTKTATPKKEGS